MTKRQEGLKCKMTVFSIIIVENWVLISRRTKLGFTNYIKIKFKMDLSCQVGSENTKLLKLI